MNGEAEGQGAPRNKAELMARIQAERAALERVLGGLSDEAMVAAGPEGWSPKDHLAHIVAWEQAVLGHLQGKSFAEAAGMDAATARATAHMGAESGLNDWFFERDRDLSLAQVREAFEQSHQQVLEALEPLTDEDLAQPSRPERPDSEPLLDGIAGDTWEHYAEHRAIIERLANAEGEG